MKVNENCVAQCQYRIIDPKNCKCLQELSLELKKIPTPTQTKELIDKIENALNPLYQNKEDNFPIPKSKYHK